MRPAEAHSCPKASLGRTTLRCAALVLCIAATLAPGGAARTAAGPALSFATAKQYAIGKKPCSMAIGDLSGDGKPDAVTADCYSTTVSVLRNHGDGTLEGTTHYAAGAEPKRVEIADLNGDVKNDLVVASSDPSISVLLNEGGTFGPSASYAVGNSPEDVLIADLNGDGKSDLLVETRTESRMVLSVLLNRGDGTFEPQRDYPQPPEAADVALGDVEGDGRPDVVVVVQQRGFSVLLNGGDGSFQAGHDYEDIFARGVAIGDLNGDGKPDLAVHEDISAVGVFLNRGDGSFVASRGYDAGAGAPFEPEAIAIADVNGDRAADVLTRWAHTIYLGIHIGEREVGGVSVLINQGHGTFSRARSYEILPSEESSELAINDLNGDRSPDIATDAGGVVTALLNRGNGSFERGLRYLFPYAEAGIATADLNGDGSPDLAGVRPAAKAVWVKLNTPGLCNVQSVHGMTLAAAKRRLGRANCRAGKVSRTYSKKVGKGHVLSQRPRFGTVLPGGSKVKLVLGRGKRPGR
jgi:hypothetical protein